MTRRAKAMSAFITGRNARSAGRNARPLAGRGASLRADGSGAPSNALPRDLHYRASLVAAALLVVTLLVLAVAPTAFASKIVDRVVAGNTGTGIPGGLFNQPRGVAVNATGAGPADAGDIYVIDGSNNRIQQFSTSDAFIRAFGRDVSGLNEQQRVTVTATAGTYRLCKDVALTECTANIAFNATGAQVATALVVPAMFGTGNVAGSGNATQPKVLTFQNAFAGTDIDELVADTTLLTGSIVIETLVEGAGGSATTFEKCEVAANCKAGITSPAHGGTFNNLQGIAVNQSTGDVYVTDSSHNRVQQFSGDGTFLRAIGNGVADGGATGTGTVTSGSNSVTAVATTSKAFVVGQEIAGTGIAPGTLITAVGSGTITLSQPATVAAEGAGTAISAPTAGGNVARNEKQTVTLAAGITAGNFKLAYTTPNPSPTTAGANTTENIPFNASAAEVQSALETLSNIGAGNVAVSSSNPGGGAAPGGPYVVEFTGTRFADTDVAQMTVAAGAPALTGGSASVATTVAGALVPETCTTATACKAGVASAEGGGFSALGHLAIAPVGAPNAGHLYVAETTNRRVQQFQANGTWVRAWGWDTVQPGGTGEQTNLVSEQQSIALAGAPCCFQSVVSGNFTLTFDGHTTGPIAWNATGPEVDAALEALPSVGAGNVVVTFTGSFGSSWSVDFTGALANTDVPQITGTSIDLLDALNLAGSVSASTPSPGGIVPGFEICTVAVECKAGANSNPANQNGAFGSSSPTHVAVGADGTLYAADSVNNRVGRFATSQVTSGSLLMPAIDVAAVTSSASTTTTGLAVMPSGNLLIGRSAALGVLELSTPAGSPAEADRHYQGANLAPNAIALDNSTGELYMTSQTGGHRLFVADDDGAVPAIVSVDPPIEVTEHTATLRGQITPGDIFLAVSYRFQLSRNGVTWDDVHSNVNLGVGTSPIPVQAAVTGLEGNTFYRVRIITQKAFGNPDVVSSEVVFLTDAVVPEVKTFNPAQIADTTATLRGQVNPNNLPTTYRFEYLTEAAYDANPPGDRFADASKAPVPDSNLSGGADKQIHEGIAGLQPDTAYRVRLAATNSEGTAVGEDIAFVTRAAVSAEDARGWEMMTPPFKALPSSFAGHGGQFNNPNPGVPSLDGEAMMWANSIFPLSDDADSPNSGDMRLMRRTAEGWTFSTRNTQSLKTNCARCEPGESSIPSLVRVYTSASSGDMETISAHIGGGGESVGGHFLETEGNVSSRLYTRRDGTGVEGWNSWLTNPSAQLKPKNRVYVLNTADSVRFNDDGSAMARSWYYRNLADDPATALDEDLSDDQQLSNPNVSGGDFYSTNGGTTVYVQRADSPEEMPTAPKLLASKCTGTGGDATQLPVRVGTGAVTDTIGTHVCEERTAPAGAGTATRSTGSATLTEVDTDSGAFAVGQIISGEAIVPGSRIASVGAETLTLNNPVECGLASGIGGHVEGQNVVLNLDTRCGEFKVGQTIVGTGSGGLHGGKNVFPGGTTITAVEGDRLTVSGNASFTDSNSPMAAAGTASMPVEANPLAVINQRGASLGRLIDLGSGNRAPVTQNAISEDGARAFLTSPSGANTAEGVPATGCTSATGELSLCVPQLFVHQVDSGGDQTVRWISRAQGVGAQRVAMLGRGAHYEGASRDGRHVYFKTNSPLLPTDPTGGQSITDAAASDLSFDLYRYTLPGSLDDDPAAGVLTRVSGGPTGTADPSTNNSTASGGSGGIAVGDGAALRYLSEDGELAYFVTTSPITGADSTPAQGGVTAPDGVVGNGTSSSGTRNLYLFDDSGASPEWRFVASLPFNVTQQNSPVVPNKLNGCASSGEAVGALGTSTAGGAGMTPQEGNCFRGTPDGKHILFTTAARLTGDDTDDASDIYLYSYQRDELTRVSAPPPGVSPYPCNGSGGGGSSSLADGACNADLGLNLRGGGTILSTGAFGAAGQELAASRGLSGVRYYNLAKDENGVVSVFFQSKSNLVPEDTDTLGRHDVYQWRQGKLKLLTPDFPEMPFWYSGSSLDGEDLFVNTMARVDPREIDAIDHDVYNLRRGGGFPYIPPATPCDVLAHQCRSTALPGPTARGSATAGFVGPGNVKSAAARCNKNQVRRGQRCVAKTVLARRACAKRKGKARQRCVRNQVRRLSQVQKRQNRANADRRAAR